MKARDGGGVLLTQAIHTLDLFLSLAGPVAELSAHHLNSGLRAIDTEDVATATLRFASGAIGSIDATSTAFPGYPERIELAGERGAAVLEAERLSVRLMDGTTIEAGSGGGGGGGADPMAFSHEANTRLLADFLDAIDEDRDPRANGRSALHVHRLIDAMLRSEGRPVAP
jgi:predicted dehydrogenase